MRHPKLILSTLAFLLAAAGTTVFAQDPNSGDNSMLQNKAASPSGNSSSLSASAAINTDLYTGKLQVSLPLFALQSSDVSVPISLNYTAGSGVRITDLNTQVGMDWTLAAGGSITRLVRGLPDESDLGYEGSNVSGRNGANNMGE